MNDILKNSIALLNHKIFLILIVLSCLFIQGKQSNKYFGWSNPKNTKPDHSLTIHTDGAGYYAYLPQWFLYKNSPHFEFIKEITKKYKTVHFASGISYNVETRTCFNKCFIGTPICISPFFLTNHLINKTIYGTGDGYSKSYQFTVSVAALFYWFLGIIGLIKLLKTFEISNSLISIVIPIISLGTDLNFYTVYFPSFSHVYSFCAISWLIYFGKIWATNKQTKYLIWLGFILGVIFIIRPINVIVVLLIPFFFRDWKDFASETLNILRYNKLKTFLALSVLILPISLQLYSAHYQIGKWGINTYGEESFEFLFNPKMYEVLFGYKKGFFMYAPVMLLLIPSVFFMVKYNKYFSFGWTIVFSLLLYATSSWWCWWYGGGLGMRPFIDFMSFLVLPIALLLKNIPPFFRLLALVFSVVMISFYQILQIQYNLNIIRYDNMTDENYWNVFLKTDKRFSWMLYFKEYNITKDDIQDSQTLYFNSSTFSWVKNKTSNKKCVLNYENPDPQFFFHPNSSWGQYKIGVRLTGDMMLHNQESIPSFLISFYKNGINVKNEELLIGNRIDEIEKFLPYSKDYIGNYKYSMIDSIGVALHKGIPITEVKNMKCTFYTIKNKATQK